MKAFHSWIIPPEFFSAVRALGLYYPIKQESFLKIIFNLEIKHYIIIDSLLKLNDKYQIYSEYNAENIFLFDPTITLDLLLIMRLNK